MALLLAAVVLVPLVQLTLQLYQRLALVKEMVEVHQRLVESLQDQKWWAVVSFVLLPAVCEELAFRWFILSGLRSRLKPWNAIWVSSFMFAVYHMNVFQFLPAFILGAILGLLTVRSGSIGPAALFHLLHNGLLVGSVWLPQLVRRVEISDQSILFLRLTVTGLCTLLAALLLWRLARGVPLSALEHGESRSSK
jgi:sodium transport system permease protein